MTETRRTRLKPAHRDRLADQAHASIRAAIMTGGFEMGERLTETQLAEDLHMSRAPVREALQRLAKEGLVVEHPRQGTFVAEMTASDVIDFYNARLGIETTAVRLFIQRGGDTEPLRRKVAEMEQAAKRENFDAVVRAELDFHRLICEQSRNGLLLSLFTELEGRLSLVMGLDDKEFDSLDAVAEEHYPVLEALEAGDASTAALVMERHILSTVGDLIGRLGGDSGQLLGPLRIRPSRRSR